ncbi:MAG: mechanosensitive ion channel family protein [Actinomycetota bacterium]|nr:mechanosensitive ion channel family protein [Actinomycetota bacterium]
MPSAILAAESFFARYGDELTALGVLALTVLAVLVIHRGVARRGRRLATAVAGGELRPELDTRLRFLQRLVDVVVVVIGLSLALKQFAGVGDVASTILTSGAIAAAVVGFAARQTLANAIAGVLLAVTQPLRIGDVVTFEGETGTVEDVRLVNTWLRTPGGTRVIIPNERLAAGVLRNDSIISAAVAVEPSIWLKGDIDPLEAVDTLRTALGDVGVRLAETTADGARLLLIGAQAPPHERAGLEHALREQALRALRDRDLSVKGNPAGNVEDDARAPR